MKKFFLAVGFLLLIFYAHPAVASFNAYILDAGVKYRPWDNIPAGTSITINAVKGQWASFQVAASVFNEDVNGIDISLTTPSSGGSLLNAPIIYKEMPYNVIVKSRDDGATGEWPDALIPKIDQHYNETRNAFPFSAKRVSPVYSVFDFNVAVANPVTRTNGAIIKPSIGGIYAGTGSLNYHIKIDSAGALGVAKFKWSDDGGVTWDATGILTGSSIALNNGLSITFPSQNYALNDEWEFFANTFRNEMIWIESYIPQNAVPGIYNTIITVTATGKTSQVLNVAMKVFDVTIPKTSSAPIYYTSSRDSVSKGHYQSWQTTAHENLYKRYVEAGLNNRISLENMAPLLSWNGSSVGNWSTYRDWLLPYMDGTWSGGSALTTAKVPTVSGQLFDWMIFGSQVKESDLTQSEKNYLTTLGGLIDAQGWMSKYYIGLAEEPTWSGASPPQTMTDAVKNGAASMHSANPGYKTIVTKRYVSEWAGGPVDVWNGWLGQFAGYPRNVYNSEVSAGRQVWSYLSCMSKGCNVTGGPSYNKWPSHMVDATFPNLRGYYWLMFDNDVKGDLYYQVADGYRYYHSSIGITMHDPWDSMFDFGGDGDGTLFYPGRPDKIGGITHIPIETLRLKALRSGLEDYEIFKYAADRGYGASAKTQIEAAVGNGKYYYVSPQPSSAAINTARNNIINLVSSIPIDTTPPLAPTGVTVG